MKNALCSIDGCDRPVLARGWCNRHWKRWKRHGEPTGGYALRDSYAGWVDAHIDYDGAGCLIWPFGRDGWGYPVAIKALGDKGHRAVCARVHGPAPSAKHEVAHSCGNGHLGCVHPKHLRWATRVENVADRPAQGDDARGAKHWNSKLTVDTVRAIRAKAGSVSQSQLAREFGVSQPAINAIISRKRWAWLA